MPVRRPVILDVMDDMDRETPAGDDNATAVDALEQPAATVAQAARLLANPRRIRRA